MTTDELLALSEALAARWGLDDEKSLRAALAWVRRWQRITGFCASLARHMLWTAVGWLVAAALVAYFASLGYHIGVGKRP